MGMVFEVTYWTPAHARRTMAVVCETFEQALKYSERFGKNLFCIKYDPNSQKKLSSDAEKI